jgi:hypothetical protein
MSARPTYDYFSIAGASVSATTGASSAVLALPTASDGTVARRVLVQTVAGACYARPALAAGSVAAGTGLVITTTPIALNVRGNTHIAHIQITGAQTLVVTPLED